MNKFILWGIVVITIISSCKIQNNSNGKGVGNNHPDQKILPTGWNAKLAADEVMKHLITATANHVKGAHDAEIVIVEKYAYIVAEVNDIKAGESPEWPYIYTMMSIVNMETLTVEKVIPMAKSEQAFDNEKLPSGACFVPRVIQKDDKYLRCYFSSENPGYRQSQVWYIDFDLTTQSFVNTIHRVRIKTSAGVFDMQPKYFYEDAVKFGLTKNSADYGLYIFDHFKKFDNKIFTAINNFAGKHNALALLNDSLNEFEVIGHYNEPQGLALSESAITRMPDNSWIAICRQDGGSRNYIFTTSSDGKNWAIGKYENFVATGNNSKPTFDLFHGMYYLGWQDSTKINGVGRSVFNVDVSRDCNTWERKYRFETDKSFQYPAFHEHNGEIWFVVTQGDTDPSRKERIMFGKLE